MVSANSNDYNMGQDSGSETNNRYQQLAGASREQISVKLYELANKYIAKTQGSQAVDPEYEVVLPDNDPEALSLQTWKIRYEDESYNPNPPLTLNKPDLHVYVTKATVPQLTVEMFHKYREHTMTQAKNRHGDNDLSVHIVETGLSIEQRTAFPTMITKINMPFMYARRAVVNTYYPKFDSQTRSFSTVSSSIMNEQVL